MQSSVMWACLLLGLVVAATASDTGSEAAAHNATSRALAGSGELVQTAERLLSAVLGSPEPGPDGRAALSSISLPGLLAAVPLKLGALKAALVAAAPGIAIAALVIGIIALAKVHALYKKLGLSAFDTVHEALPKFGLPGVGFPEEGEYDGYGHYDPTEYAYHDKDYGSESSYAGYASRRGQTAGQSGGGQPAARTRFDQPTESRVVRRTPSVAPLPLAWS